MPTYEYKCKKCGKIFDVFQKITDEPIKKCPDCGGDVIRLISGGVGIIFKGSGFYITDNKSSNRYTRSSKSKSTESSDTKPDQKTEKTTAKDKK